MKQYMKPSLMLLAITATTLVACEKQVLSPADREAASQLSRNPVRRAFKVETQTYYRFSPVLDGNFQPTIIPVTINGTDYWGMSHVPGSGTGSTTHLGEVRTYFNQLAYWPVGTTNPAAVPISGSIAAAVRDIEIYPVILPFPGGKTFPTADDLAIIKTIPREINGVLVNSVVINAKGEAVYMGYNTAGSFITPLSPTAIRFGGKLTILGGTGRFAAASGTADFLGQFNPQNQDDAWYTVNGSIVY